MSRRSRGLVAGAALLLCGLAESCGAGTLEPFLERLSQGKRTSVSAPAARVLAWDEKEAARSRARVLVLRAESADWAAVRAGVESAAPSAVWEGEAGRLAQLVATWSELPAIARAPGVEAVTRPPRAVPLVESEGLPGMRASDLRDLGYEGRSVRAAVLDLGFARYETLVGSELPFDLKVRSFFRSPSGAGDITGDPDEEHGTACAEILHDVAPGSTLYLVNVETPVDLKNAVDWLIDEKVSVISHSVGWYFGGLDGHGPINDIAEEAARHGVLWVNAAGNEAERHTWAPAVDLDGDDLFEFEGDERIDFRVRAGETLAIVLLWDQWPLATSVDAAIEFLDGSTVIATSADDLENYPYAFRYVEWQAPQERSIAVQVRLNRGSLEGRTLHLFRLGSGVRMEEHPRADRSLLVPADSPSVLAVGATDWATDSLDSYSSRGALDGAWVKPELCGPVGVSTWTYGREGFRGTSAAAPHVAGAAALLASTGLRGAFFDLLWSREELRDLLRDHARPAPEIPSLAWGLVALPSQAPEKRGTGLRMLRNPAQGSLAWEGPCGEVDLVDVRGRRLAGLAGGTWNGVLPDGRILPAGVYWLRCRQGRPSAVCVLWLGRGR